ncbi:MAG: S41 family peptidase [Halanaerobiales bacterium]
MKRNSKLTVVILIVSLFLSLPILAGEGDESDSQAVFDTFNEVLAYILNYHVDENEIDELIRGAMDGMADTIDPYSEYMTSDEYKEMQVEYEGHFGGIGIVITPDLTIVSPIKGTPGERVGLQSGDNIIAIEGEPTEDMSQKEAVDLMRGEPGTEVNITIQREGVDEPLKFKIIREDVEIPYVEWEMKTDKVGYINIVQFIQGVGSKVSTAISELEEQGAEALLLDLRTNPGGLLDEAISVSSSFLDEGTVVSVKYRVGSDDIYNVEKDIYTTDLPLVVLINQGSASASEIVAGAVKDNHRGILFGKKTFGKGTVQSLFPLNDGSALKLTTGKYYTPSGNFIHEKGIKPDVEVEYNPDYEGENDNQLDAALQYIQDNFFEAEIEPAA